MKEIRYADAGMDMKKYVLCLLRRFPLVLAAALLGGLLGAAVYMFVRTVPESEREYQAYSKIYLDFAADETGEVYQEYNGYTWNDLMVTDPILNLTMNYLPSDYTREEVMAATEATILSDLRLLTITITTRDVKRTDQILSATDQALEAYGDRAKEFIRIETIQTTEAKLLVVDSRMAQAILLGVLLGFAFSLFAVTLYYVMDDRILVAGDIKRATDVSFYGYISAGELFRKDYENNLDYLKEKLGNVLVCDVVPGETLSGERLRELRLADGVILTVPYGKIHGVYLLYVIEQLHSQECNVCGVAIRDGDEKFLHRYYGRLLESGK